MTAGLRIGVIADDLTSAADGAAPFTEAGHRARIFLAPTLNAVGLDLVAIDTDSRRVSADSGAIATARAVTAVGFAPILFKTVDSTLRGHLVEEINAALSASGRPIAVVAPAFPAEGRTTIGGHQFVHGIPVEQTRFAHDPTNPARNGDLFTILPGAVPLDSGNVQSLSGIIIADAITDADLDDIVSLFDDPSRVLWVGSPGLAAALARRYPGTTPPTQTALAPTNRVLVVVGSQHDLSRLQLQHLAEDTAPVAATGSDIADAAQLTATLDKHGWAALTDDTTGGDPHEVGRRLGRIVALAHQDHSFDGLIATGGATGRALLEALRITQVDLVAEPEPGVVALHAAAPHDFPILLKAGGFGDPQTLIRLTHALNSSHRSSK